jgi:hypothetical protein
MIASISLDLDNKWSYLKSHGDESWQEFPSYLQTVVPRTLDILRSLDLRITFFIVGQDAVFEENRLVLRSIADAGHEIGNHSFHHEPWLHLYSDVELQNELIRSEAAILDFTGQQTIGFRGPGFSHSPKTLMMLSERGYLYDASTFPTYMGPLARAYYFMHSSLDRAERQQRKQLFGAFSNGFLPLKPYRHKGKAEPLIEIPVTTFPLFKVPIHFSYIMYLATFSRLAAVTYFRSAMRFCKLNRVQPSLLLHPLDFLGKDDEEELTFFPGMNAASDFKLPLAEQLLLWMTKQFDCVTMAEHAHAFDTK